MTNDAYEKRVEELMEEGMTRSDAQAIADVEDMSASGVTPKEDIAGPQKYWWLSPDCELKALGECKSFGVARAKTFGKGGRLLTETQLRLVATAIERELPPSEDAIAQQESALKDAYRHTLEIIYANAAESEQWIRARIVEVMPEVLSANMRPLKKVKMLLETMKALSIKGEALCAERIGHLLTKHGCSMKQVMLVDGLTIEIEWPATLVQVKNNDITALYDPDDVVIDNRGDGVAFFCRGIVVGDNDGADIGCDCKIIWEVNQEAMDNPNRATEDYSGCANWDNPESIIFE